jgi:tetratricopeptide (TPR) repeat protein
MMMAAAYQDLVQWNAASKKPLQLAFGAYLVVLGLLTFQRCAVWRDSLSLWDDVLAQYPKAAKALFNRGYAKYYLGDYTGSLHDFDRAIAVDPTYADAHYNRASVRLAFKDVQGALDDWTRAIALNPSYAEAYFNRGLTYYQAHGDLKKAIEDYDQALKWRPDLAVAWYTRGIGLLDLGDTQQGCENLRKARQLGDPNAAAVLAARCR